MSQYAPGTEKYKLQQMNRYSSEKSMRGVLRGGDGFEREWEEYKKRNLMAQSPGNLQRAYELYRAGVAFEDAIRG